jgi:hypothetical protein
MQPLRARFMRWGTTGPKRVSSWVAVILSGGLSLFAAAHAMIGSKLPDEVLFHVHLAALHKIELSKDAMQLLGDDRAKKKVDRAPNETPNKVLLCDVSQLSDKNQTQSALFRRDSNDFVGLRAPLDPLPENHKEHKKEAAMIHVCDDEFVQFCSELVEVGNSASKWISKCFLDHPDVMVSSRAQFEGILMTWLEDP